MEAKCHQGSIDERTLTFDPLKEKNITHKDVSGEAGQEGFRV